jgi:hypothetical protein
MERAEVKVQVDPDPSFTLSNVLHSRGTDQSNPRNWVDRKAQKAKWMLEALEGNGTGCNKTGMIENDTGFEPEDVAETRLPPKKICVPNKRGNKLMRNILWRDAYPPIWKWKPKRREGDYTEVLEELSSKLVKWLRMPIGLWPSVLVSPSNPR